MENKTIISVNTKGKEIKLCSVKKAFFIVDSEDTKYNNVAFINQEEALKQFNQSVQEKK